MRVSEKTRNRRGNKWLALTFISVLVLGVAVMMARQNATAFEPSCPRDYFCVNSCPVAAISLDDRGFPQINRTKCLAWDKGEDQFVWERCGLCLQGCPTKVISILNTKSERYFHTVE